jgi:hypothetical protein
LNRIRVWWVICIAFGIANASGQPVSDEVGNEQIRLLLERSAAARSGQVRPALSTAQQAQREALLKTGEAALAALDIERAYRYFERASLILHAADAEMGLVRTAVQQGAYKRALALAAHVAGAHTDSPKPAVLYALLLNAGGHTQAALQTISTTPAAASATALHVGVKNEIEQAILAPNALVGWARPYSGALPKNARAVSAGIAIGDGGHAVVATATLPANEKMWVRNGLGEIVAATRVQSLVQGLTIIRLKAPLSTYRAARMAERPPFPGSPVTVVAFDAEQENNFALPLLRSGFVGPADAIDARERELTARGLPRAFAGAAFNQSGHIIGLALPSQTRTQRLDRLISFSALSGALPLETRDFTPLSTQRLASDEVFEMCLANCVQVITIARRK